MKFKWKPGKPYIVPTLYGIAYFFLILNVFALGYYRNSAPFHTVGLTLSVLGLVAMIQTNGSTRGISCSVEELEPSQAHSLTKLKLRLLSQNPEGHFNLECEPEKAYFGDQPATLDYFRDGHTLGIPLLSGKRGIYRLKAIKISSRGLFGLFYTWTWLPIEGEWVVYPQPEGHLPLPQTLEGESERLLLGEEFQGHRPHVAGTPLRHIDWKAYARSDRLLVKDFQQENEGAVHLSLSLIPARDRETQLEQVCAWMFICFEQNRPFSLDLLGETLPTGSGVEHLQKSLYALAAWGESR